ncbi:MAG: GTP-binding protein [Bacillota bacterium]
MHKTPTRNVGIFAHVDAGKTTTTEHLLFCSGAIRKLGRVNDGTAQTDRLEVERERGISVKSASASLEWNGTRLNLIDTPGHVDFLSEVERPLRVMDGAVLIISAAEGIQSQTETVWQTLRSLGIPTLLYINKMDRTGVDCKSLMDEIRRVLSPDIFPVNSPLGEGETFHSVSSIWSDSDSSNPAVETSLHYATELAAGLDEDLLDRYVENGTLPKEDIRNKLKEYTLIGQSFPVCFGASQRGIGIRELLDHITEYLPEAGGNEGAELSGVVYKIERDSNMGRTAYVRLYNGILKNRDSLFNSTRNITEKITQIRKMDSGGKLVDTGQAAAGDIAAVYGLVQTRIGDILGNTEGVPASPEMAVPLLTVQVRSKEASRYQELAEALQELTDEDPLLDFQWMPVERELHLKVMGTIQLEILENILLNRYHLEVVFDPPSVIYKETLASATQGFVAYTMPKPCWAVLRFDMEPLPRGSGLEYSSIVRNENLLQSYQNEVARRVPEALRQGLFGWEVTDLKITLVEGEHHVWHTHPLDFVIATPMAVMNGLAASGTILLEPMLRFRLTVPEENGGRMLSDLVQMRATFDSPVISGGRCIVEGLVPAAESLDFPIQVRSLTGGRGVWTTSFAGYEQCPPGSNVTRERRGVNPLDQSHFILSMRNALSNV